MFLLVYIAFFRWMRFFPKGKVDSELARLRALDMLITEREILADKLKALTAMVQYMGEITKRCPQESKDKLIHKLNNMKESSSDAELGINCNWDFG